MIPKPPDGSESLHEWDCPCDSCQERREEWSKRQSPLVLEMNKEDGIDEVDLERLANTYYCECGREMYKDCTGGLRCWDCDGLHRLCYDV